MEPSFRYGVGEYISKYQVRRQIVQGELIEDYLLIDEKGETFFMRVLVSQAPKSAKFEWLFRLRQQRKIKHGYLATIVEILEDPVGVILDTGDGFTLEEYLLRSTPSLSESLVLAARVLKTMLALHEKDIFHQAISKRSIFIVPSENGNPQVSVLSVGVGIAHEQDVENLKCAAPEAIAKPNRARIRSDLYSVSMLLAQILTDRDLVSGKTSEEVRKAVENTTVFDDLQLPREIPTKISEEIRKGLNRDVLMRHPNGFMMINRLYEVAAEQLSSEPKNALIPIQKPPPQPPKSEQKNKGKERGKDASADQQTGSFGGGFSGGSHTSSDSQKNRDESDDTNENVNIDDEEDIALGEDFFDNLEGQDSHAEGSANLQWENVKAEDLPPSLYLSEDEKTSPRRTSRPIVPGLLITLLLSFGYWNFFRGRDIDIKFVDLPDWGRNTATYDGKELIFNYLQKEKEPYGEHSVVIRGGVFTRDQCTRCCWTREATFEVKWGFGVQEIPIVFDQKPECPSAKFDYQFSLAPAGEFIMGSDRTAEDRNPDEFSHNVKITRSFMIGQTEVTQDLYQFVMEGNPSRNQSEKRPVETLSWYDAVRFANKISVMEGLEECYNIDGMKVSWQAGVACLGYRLPTEAEWEYAARTGGTEPKNWEEFPKEVQYSGGFNIDMLGWYKDNAQGETHEVKERKSNSWELYDMSGNVYEWCWDYYGMYEPKSNVDPLGPLTGDYRILRGGDWRSSKTQARVASRYYVAPRLKTPYIGFRIVRSIVDE